MPPFFYDHSKTGDSHVAEASPGNPEASRPRLREDEVPDCRQSWW